MEAQKISIFRRILGASPKEAIARYPVSFIAMVIAAVTGTIIAHDNLVSTRLESIIGGVFFVACLGVVAYTALALVFERAIVRSRTQMVWYGVVTVLLGWVWYRMYAANFEDTILFVWWILFFGAAVFFLLGGPFLKANNERTLWLYGKEVVLRACVAFVPALVIHIALALALVSMNYLFKLELDSDYYSIIAVWAFAVIGPTIFLLGASDMHTHSEDQHASFPLFLKRFALYILLPILALYFLILYSYLAKIGYQWELPEEGVVMPIVAFSIIGVITYVLIDPWRRSEQSRIYARLQQGIMMSFLPLLPLYVVAIYERVRTYGLTEARYMVIVYGIWLLFIAAYYLLDATKQLRVIPLSLFVLFAVAISPAGAVDASVQSQIKKLEDMFVRHGVLVDGALTNPVPTITGNDGEVVQGAFSFLRDHSALYRLGSWVDASGTREQQSQHVAQRIGNFSGIVQHPQWFVLNTETRSFGVPVAGAHTMLRFDLSGSEGSRAVMDTPYASLYLDRNTKDFVVTPKDGAPLRISLVAYVRDYSAEEGKEELTIEEATRTVENDSMRLWVIFLTVNGRKLNGTLDAIDHVEGLAFISNK